jgi:hypothetical protein
MAREEDAPPLLKPYRRGQSQVLHRLRQADPRDHGVGERHPNLVRGRF